MLRPKLEVADIFRRYGEAWRDRNAAHLSRGQRRVMSAIEICRTAALGGHVERCDDCAHTRVAYNSCRNRHCPKCQWRAAEAWLEARKAELLPVPYFHVVFTLPAAIGAIAYQNKAQVYGLLFTAAAEALTTIAADQKHLGAQIGVTAVLHTWGQNLDHHPHVHCIVPGGGTCPSGTRWVPSRHNFFLSVRVLSRLFRRLFLSGLAQLHAAGELQFFGDLAHLADRALFEDYLAPLRATEWVVYAKRPFAGPSQVLAYLARYTHRVAIANSRLVSIDDDKVAFRWKDYREDGERRRKVMTLDAGEFMRRFLLHVLPDGFHRIRYYGLFANGHRADKLALCRKLLEVTADAEAFAATGGNDASVVDPPPCPCCGGRMRIVETFDRGMMPRSAAPVVAIRHEPDPHATELARPSSTLVIGRRHTGAHAPSPDAPSKTSRKRLPSVSSEAGAIRHDQRPCLPRICDLTRGTHRRGCCCQIPIAPSALPAVSCNRVSATPPTGRACLDTLRPASQKPLSCATYEEWLC